MAVFSYIGASPIPSATLRDVVMVSAMVGAFAWPRLMGRRALSCSLPSTRNQTTSHENPELATHQLEE